MIYNDFSIITNYNKEKGELKVEINFPLKSLMVKEENNIYKIFNDYFLLYIDNTEYIKNLSEIKLVGYPEFLNKYTINNISFEFYDQNNKKINVLYYVILDFLFNSLLQILSSTNNILINDDDFAINQEKDYDWLIKQKHTLVLLDNKTSEPCEIYIKPDRADIIYKWVLNKYTNKFKSTDIVSWDEVIKILQDILNESRHSNFKIKSLSGLFFVIKQKMLSGDFNIDKFEKEGNVNIIDFNENAENIEDENEFFTKNLKI